MRGGDGQLVPLRELMQVEHTREEQGIYHKNLLPVISTRQRLPVNAAGTQFA